MWNIFSIVTVSQRDHLGINIYLNPVHNHKVVSKRKGRGMFTSLSSAIPRFSPFTPSYHSPSLAHLLFLIRRPSLWPSTIPLPLPLPSHLIQSLDCFLVPALIYPSSALTATHHYLLPLPLYQRITSFTSSYSVPPLPHIFTRPLTLLPTPTSFTSL